MRKFLRTLLSCIIVCIFASCAFALGDLIFSPSNGSDLPDGTVGKRYSASISVSNSSGSTFTWNINGLPNYLTANTTGATAKITGTPSTAGKFLIIVNVNNNKGESGHATFNMTINPADENNGGGDGGGESAELTISGYLDGGKVGDKLPDNNYGELIGVLEVDGGTEPYTWRITQGDLPPGLSLACSNMGVGKANSNTGTQAVLRGVPTTTGTYNFTVEVKDADNNTITKNCSVKVDGKNIDDSLEILGDFIAPLVSWTGSFNSYEGQVYAGEYAKRTPFKWSLAAGKLPTGLEFACSDSAYFSGEKGDTTGKYCYLKGNLAGNGVYKFALRLTDADGRSITRNFTFTAEGGNTTDYTANGNVTLPTISDPVINSKFTNGKTGEAYSSYIYANKGNAPYRWSIVPADGYFPADIPDGLKLTCSSSSSSTGSGTTGQYAHITGTPKSEGFYNFTLKVTDSDGVTTAKAFVIKIEAGSSQVNPTPTPNPDSGDSKPNPTPNPVESDDAAGDSSDVIANPDALNIKYIFSDGTTGTHYEDFIEASGGIAPYEWELDGNLPNGLEAGTSKEDNNKERVYIVGTPTTAGTFDFSLKVTDSVGESLSKDFSITIQSSSESYYYYEGGSGGGGGCSLGFSFAGLALIVILKRKL